ncbi:MAG TPA: hypothetical protein VK028_15655 [Micromonosporaceae bacterium]|nr:hypothetical protein [Micromonosporaceae bacterium]
MPQTASFDPDQTVAATWRQRLMGTRPDPKPHWRTKVAYYTAVCEVVAASPGQLPSWREIVAAVRQRGSRSTFYEVTGGGAKHPLLRAYRQAATPDALQVAYLYKRRRAVEQLIDEAKVWAFWPFREEWTRRARPVYDLDSAANAYLAAVADWARHSPFLAAAIDFAPPACAVEDIAALTCGRLPAIRAHAVLRDVIQRAATEGDDDEESQPAAAAGSRATVVISPATAANPRATVVSPRVGGGNLDIAWIQRSAWPPPRHADLPPPSVPVTRPNG